MKVGDLVKLKGDDIRGTAPEGIRMLYPLGRWGSWCRLIISDRTSMTMRLDPSLNFLEMEELARFSLTIWRSSMKVGDMVESPHHLIRGIVVEVELRGGNNRNYNKRSSRARQMV